MSKSVSTCVKITELPSNMKKYICYKSLPLAVKSNETSKEKLLVWHKNDDKSKIQRVAFYGILFRFWCIIIIIYMLEDGRNSHTCSNDFQCYIAKIGRKSHRMQFT